MKLNSNDFLDRLIIIFGTCLSDTGKLDLAERG